MRAYPRRVPTACFEMIDLRLLRQYVAVAEELHFHRAAARLHMSQPPLTAAIRRLEDELGSELIVRGNRTLGLTVAGQTLLVEARATLQQAEQGLQRTREAAAGQSGSLRVGYVGSALYGRLPGLIRRFRQQYPQVQVELNITNRNVDLVAEGFDLAIRLGQLPDSGLVARKLEDAPLLLVAAPDYLQRRGTPQTLDDLQQHLCLPFVMPRTGRLAPWIFRDGGRDVDWLPRSSIETSDDVLGVVSLAEQGIGICQSYAFIVRERLQRGQLVEVLPQLRGRSRPFSVIYATHRRQSAAARAMIELLVGNAAEDGTG